MKRGFLFGSGSFLAFVLLEQLDEAFRGECGLAFNDVCYASAAVTIALWASLSVLAIWRASVAAPHMSRHHAIGGWLIGFCFTPVAVMTLFFAPFFAAATISYFLK
jgi:hypothetical protein